LSGVLPSALPDVVAALVTGFQPILFFASFA